MSSTQQIDLTPFCAAKDDPRIYLHQPFSLDIYTIASNGHLAIIVPRRQDAPEITDKPAINNNFRKAIDTALQRGAESGRLQLSKFDPELIGCSECEGTGKTHTCPECDGLGETTFSGEFEVYEVECKICEGRGTVSDMEINRLKSQKSAGHPVAESNPGLCITCVGSGKHPKQMKHRLGDATLGAHYLLQLKSLPEATVYAYGKTDPVRIDFDGGFGILMPRHD